MNKDNQQGFKNFMKGNGYLLVLGCCAIVIAVSGLLYSRTSRKPQKPVHEPAVTENRMAQKPTEDQAVDAISPQTNPTEATQAPTEGALKTMSPVKGETAAVFAADHLAYNETTKDWRVHHGIDLAAPAGTKVQAAADGEVYTVYEDDTMGTTVVIRHQGGYTTTYASLSKEVSVKAGDKVNMGDTIGTVGATALTEKALGDHVHFSVTCNGALMNPEEFIKG